MQLHRFPEYVAGRHNITGGCTSSVERGDLSGQPGYAVGVFPERSLKVPGATLTAEVVAGYLTRNIDAFRVATLAVGTWFDGTTTWVDLSAVVPNKRLAIRLGRKYNQVAVWDLKRGVEVPCGGDGSAPANLPPAGERLAV